MANEDYVAPIHDPQMVATEFVHQYYTILFRNPDLAYRFYEDSSSVSRPGSDGKLITVSTMEKIKDLIMAQDYEGCQLVFVIDCQASQRGGIIVVVTGTWKRKETVQSFSETFFLAPNQTGYYVLNDILKYVGEPVALTPSEVEFSSEADDVVEEAFQTPVEATPVLDCALISESPKSPVVVPAEEDKVVPAPKEEVVVSDPAVEEQVISNAETLTKLDLPKKLSYAKIAGKEALNSGTQVLANKVVVVAPSSTHYLDRTAPAKAKANNGSLQNNLNNKFKDLTKKNRPQVSNRETEGKGIFIGDLPSGVKVEVVTDVFKSFGPIRKGGVQVLTSQDEFSYGFVHFESEASATAAIKARKIMVGLKEAYITEKKQYSNQGYNGRSPSGDRSTDGYQVRPRSGDSSNGNSEGRLVWGRGSCC